MTRLAASEETDDQTVTLDIEAEAKRGRRLRIQAELTNQYAVDGQWLKGNLHCHLDRASWQGEAEDLYHRLGYDFVAGMDHDRLVELPDRRTDLLVIPGAELSTPSHVGALGIKTIPSNQQPVTAQLAEVKQQGGLSFVTHPLNGGWRLEDFRGLCEAGLDGLEIVNSAWWGKGDRGYCDQLWQLLLLEGFRLFAVGNDDAHGPERYADATFGSDRLGWTGVLVEERSEAGVLAALRAGRCYASQGPVIKGIEVTDDGRVVVSSSPCRVCHFPTGKWGAASTGPADGGELGERFVFDFATSGYRAADFIRVVLEDARGCRAWATPIWFTKRQERLD